MMGHNCLKSATLALVLLAAPAGAWTFTPTPICTLYVPTEKGGVTVTYDPTSGIYEIALTLTQGEWPQADSFGIAFIGPAPLQIGTDQHRLSPDRKTLRVQDTGFGNVLDGLEFNAVAQAVAGDMSMVVSLADAADPVAAFRACETSPIS